MMMEAEAAGGAEGHDAGRVAVVAGGGVVHQAELVLVARQERGVRLQRRVVLPQPEPAAALPPRAAARRRRRGLVLVGEPRVELAAREAREQHDRVEVGGAACRRRRRASEEERGEQQSKGRDEAAMVLRRRLHFPSGRR